MARTTPAAVSYEDKRTVVQEMPIPAPSADHGLLKVELTGVCGSDWPYYQKYPKSKGPLILGHEVVGVVTEMGAEAAARLGFREGDRVAIEEYIPCGHCRYCRSGDFRLCDETDTLNYPDTVRYGSTPGSRAPALWGGYSQYLHLTPNAVLHKVPDKVPALLATLALPLGNGVEWAYLQGGVKFGETVVIQGPGQQGLACCVAAKAAGAGCVIVTGRSSSMDQRRLALARTLGADHTITIDQQDLVATVTDITGGQMADLVIDCASGGTETVVSAIALARKAGRIILGGRKFKRVPDFDSDVLISRFLTVKGMRGHSFESVEIALQIIASGRWPLESLCTHVFGLDEVDEALRTVGGEGRPDPIHCAVDPWR